MHQGSAIGNLETGSGSLYDPQQINLTAFYDVRVGIGKGKLEHVLAEVDGERGNGRIVGRSMHGGLFP